ncbi:transporter substrate-binding domain-containing protein [Moraxella sp.]|uniref:transporter substrate-binding domain-containing protein n=1 Tax=Moraxella sp. TaxID=479 RepID=UPI0026DBAF34|nr:transporter substrate-binding domain-containing protein [Moraxella sp.]MDO4895071.1 transporter substrate-binding domain-containing protein [Moraxella sp.]
MTKILKIASTVLAITALTACGNDKTENTAANTEEKVVRIATESSFKPFSYLDNQGNLAGFEIDLANALCEEMKTKCEISSQDWDGLIPGLNADKFDAVMAGMSITEERLKVVDFSEPYFDNTLVLVGKKGDTSTIADVDGKAVATQQATISADYLQKNHPKALIKVYDKQDNAYLDLTAGRVQFMLSDIVPISDWLTTEQGKDFEVKGEPIDIGDKVGIAVVKDSPFKAQFDAALASLKANGKYAQISDKYFGAAK